MAGPVITDFEKILHEGSEWPNHPLKTCRRSGIHFPRAKKLWIKRDPPERFLSYGQNCEPYSKANCWVYPHLHPSLSGWIFVFLQVHPKVALCPQYLLNVVPVTLKEDFGCHRAIKSFWLQNILHNSMYLEIHTSIMFLLQIISKTKIGSEVGSWPNFQNGRS